MGCHGAGAQGGAYTQDQVRQGKGGTDFSFILFAARSNPDDQGVETIMNALQQITPGAEPLPPLPWFKNASTGAPEPAPVASHVDDFVMVSALPELEDQPLPVQQVPPQGWMRYLGSWIGF